MAFKTIQKTLTGGNDQLTTTHTPARQAIVYNDTGNAAVLVGDKNISATIFGFSVAVAGTGPSIGPFAGSLPFNLEDIWLRGTAGNIIRVAYVT